MPKAALPVRRRIRLPAAAYRTGRPFLLTLHAARRTEPFRRDDVAGRVAARLDAALAPEGGPVLAWCLMPDHLHVVVAGAPDVVGWVCSFKSITTRDSHSVGWIGALWQRSFHDRRLGADQGSVDGAIRYVVNNPVRAALVADVSDWPYWRVGET